MKKSTSTLQLIAILSLVLFAIVAVGCGGSSQAPAKAPDKVTLKLAHNLPKEMVAIKAELEKRLAD